MTKHMVIEKSEIYSPSSFLLSYFRFIHISMHIKNKFLEQHITEPEKKDATRAFWLT